MTTLLLFFSVNGTGIFIQKTEQPTGFPTTIPTTVPTPPVRWKIQLTSYFPFLSTQQAAETERNRKFFSFSTHYFFKKNLQIQFSSVACPT